MKFASAILASLGCVASVSVVTDLNPLGQVLALLEKLSSEISKDAATEDAQFKEFSEWCKDAATNKQFEIKTNTAQKEKLEATIAQNAGAVEVAASRIQDLAADIAAVDSELKNATAIRTKEAQDFTASEAELVETIDTIGRAISLLAREMAKKAASFSQISMKVPIEGFIKSLELLVDGAGLVGADQQRLLAFAQAQQTVGTDDDGLGAPQSAAYESHSGNIIDVLEDLKEKAEEQLSELRKASSNSGHNYEMLRQSLSDQMTADNKELEEVKLNKAGAEEAKATAEGDLTITARQLEDNKVALEVASTQCASIATDHEASVAARAEELKAIADAIAVLKESTDGAVSQTYAFIQMAGSSRTSVRLQTTTDLANYEVVNLIKRLAREQHSASLAQLASQVVAVMKFGSAEKTTNPFMKVREMISQLIDRLQQQSISEATEKSFCDEERAKSSSSKEELQGEAAVLAAKFDKAASASAELKEEVKELSASLATLAREQAEMDELRQQEHAQFVQAKSDLETGLAGVQRALVTLREYYRATEIGASLLQASDSISEAMHQPALPTTHSKASGAGSSIIGLLEVVQSDFASGLAKVETTEADAAGNYEKTTQSNKVSTAIMQQDVKYKSSEATSLDKTMAEISSDRATTDAELSAVLEYIEKLRARCVAKPTTYEDRKARRAAEIAGLKEALSILESEASLVQRNKRGHGHFLAAVSQHALV